jgi:hypothetical protein
VAQHSAGYKSLLKTKWITLMGASVAVFSSTASCVNMGMFFILGGSGTLFWANPHLHVMVFGMNLDSVLNDIGMLLVCGVVKNVDCSSLVNRISTARSVYKVGPTPQPQLQPQPQPTGACADPSIIFDSQEGDQALSIHSKFSSVAVSSVAQES